MYKVVVPNSVTKRAKKMPKNVQEVFGYLLDDLAEKGPVRREYPNYSTLDNEGLTHHCHLARKWVACWRSEKGTLVVEVYYVGSRESAPYARH